MAQKKVLITFNRPPFGSIHYVEGLRASVGVISGLDEHEASMAYIGDGVYNTLKNVNREEQMGYLGTLTTKDIKIYVEKESLQERGISESDIYDKVEVITRADLDKHIRSVDATVDF